MVVSHEILYEEGCIMLKRFVKFFLGEVNVGKRARLGHFLKEIKKYDLEKSTILDAGCGDGEYVLILRKQYPKSIFEGIEFSLEKVIKLTNRIRHFENVKIIHDSLVDFSVSEKYDFVYCIDVLEHIKEDKKVLKNLCAALKFSGILYIHVPKKIQNGFFKRFKDYLQDDHVRKGYELEELIYSLRENGLQILKAKFTMGRLVTFVWEIQKYIEDILSRRLSQLLCYPVVVVASLIEVHSTRNIGNGILVVAKKNG
jgi:SAM-dependent methyltransferase